LILISQKKEKTMVLHKKIPLTFEERDYEIRVLYDDTNINVVAFLDNHPANGFRHQIKLSKKWDVNKILKTEMIEELIEISKGDITEKRWKIE